MQCFPIVPCVLDECPAVGLETGDSATNVFVDLNNLLHGARLQKRAGHSLLHTEDNALTGLDSDGCAAKLDGFERVFDLEETAFGREGARKVLERRRRSRSIECGRYILDATI
jgi:hypothetical protein